MCGRYTAGRHQPTSAREALADIVLQNWPVLPARYDISPGTEIPVIRLDRGEGATLTEIKWGLLPHWAKEPQISFNTINAMAETVATRASYRVPFRKCRCLVPADGLYEWQPLARGKQKWWLHRVDDGDFCFAGLWDRWHRGDQVIESCTIIVTDAAESIRHVHTRMPVILDPKDYEFWLDPAINDAPALKDLLKPAPSRLFEAHKVANKPRPHDDDATLIAALTN